MLTRQAKLAMAASLAEIIAAVGVMISVIYLAIQVNHGNKEAQLQNYNDTLTLINAPIHQFLEQPEFADLVRIGGTNPDDLSESEWFRFSYYYMIQYSAWEFVFYAHRDDVVVPQLWLGMDASWRHIIASEPGVRKAWREWRHAFPQPFQGYVDSIVNDSKQAEN